MLEKKIKKTLSHIDKIGWRFDNTYAKLPNNMLSRLVPIPVKAPEVVIFNYSLSKEMGLDFSNINNEDLRFGQNWGMERTLLVKLCMILEFQQQEVWLLLKLEKL